LPVFVAALFPPSLAVYRWVKIELGLTNAQQYERENYGPYGHGPTSFVAISRYIAERTAPNEGVFEWGTVQGIKFPKRPSRAIALLVYASADTRKPVPNEVRAGVLR
jgi:hypothetical protein